ncbi:MAG: signal recognition particle-docking protein FtsY [Saprospiraceae bacterium]|nr:signal recognition particle-docking protein FtsY [Saprospiraceae bacterium]
MGFFNKLFGKKQKEDLNQGLEKTKQSFFGKISKAIAGKSKVDDEVLDDLEDILVQADVGVDTTIKIIKRIEDRVAKDKYVTTKELNGILKDEIVQLLALNNSGNKVTYDIPDTHKPHVILVVGVNGSGKTTSIGKLAHQFTQRGHKVVLGAADTFRAAAVDQLKIWSERVGCGFYAKGMYTDPAAVAYETTRYAVDNGYDICIIDTSGRLQNNKQLMLELNKIKKAVDKCLPGAPHEVMLVLDSSIGQNAFSQATGFTKAADVTCMTMTKLDGTAKGGVVIGISDQFKIPIKYIGVGEGIDHLQVFDKREFVESFFEGSKLA